jgi:S1-C subfamily serine protease
MVVGTPMGLEQTVSEGIVSSIREIPLVGEFFQMSASISPGSSGGPVINLKGEVIGVSTFQFVRG